MWMPNSEFSPQWTNLSVGFLPEDVFFTDICQKQENNLFSQILSKENHVLHQITLILAEYTIHFSS